MTERLTALRKEVLLFPTDFGVYLMRNTQKQVIYVGKAKNIKKRVLSYFRNDNPVKTQALMKRVVSIEYSVTESEFEALLYECNLIKEYRPRYNVRLKDDKNFPYFVLDFKHDFPRFTVTRKPKLSRHRKYFGPFGGSSKDMSRYLMKAFQLRDCSDHDFQSRQKPCLNYQIKICTAPCVGLVSQQGYREQVDEAILFLTQGAEQAVEATQQKMDAAAQELNFELAKKYRDQLQAIQKMASKQSIVELNLKKDIDVLGYQVQDDVVLVVVLHFRSGYLVGKHHWTLTDLVLDETSEFLSTVVLQLYQNLVAPHEIWLPIKISTQKEISDQLSDQLNYKVKLKKATTEMSHKLMKMAEENASVLLRQYFMQKSPADELMKLLHLNEKPISIEAIDISNLGETAIVGAVVHFEDGVPLKSRYRLYHPKTVVGQDDFGMISEVVSRHFKDKDHLPDLLLIDGGKGQLSAAADSLKQLGAEVPLVSIAKSRTQKGFTLKEVSQSEERLFVPEKKEPLDTTDFQEGLRLLMKIRDEVHRFAITSHRKLRDKQTLSVSQLTQIKGLGEKTKQKLLSHFSTMKNLREASVEELKTLGLPEKLCERIKKKFFES